MTLRLKHGDSLVIASHNKGKLREFEDLFGPLGITLSSAGDLDVPEPEETGETFEDNAQLKAVITAFATSQIALSDDSGLTVDALDGAPGVHSARWAGEARDFSYAMQRVEDALQAKGATAPGERRAAFICVLCLANPTGTGPILRGENRRASCLAASRYEGIWLRSDVCSRWLRTDFRGNGPRTET